MTRERLDHLDGQRGIAILLVVGFHVYARWADLMPFGDRFADVPLFKAGWLGVELFFLISGYVILMTLEKCSSVRQFLWRRWLRLFPAMLICSALIYLSAPLFHERPLGQPSLESLLPGLSLIDPAWWAVVGVATKPLELSFWSLYVEFKFYVFAAIIYFARGATAVIAALTAAYGLYIGVWSLAQLAPGPALNAAKHVLDLLSFYYFGWFASGAAFYLFAKTRQRRWMWTGLGIGLVSAAFVRELRWEPALVAAFVPMFFALSIVSPSLQWLLRRRALLVVGAASYPLYLLHENLLVSATVKMGRSDTGLPDIALPLPPLLALLFVAWLIARHAEPIVRRRLQRLLPSREPAIGERGAQESSNRLQ